MNKLFLTGVALVFTSQAYAANLKLPVGDCLLSIPEKRWCGIFTVKPNQTMKYVAGPCKDGQVEIKYRAKSIRLNGNTITMDNDYHFDIDWISPRGMEASVSFRYTDKQGVAHSGKRRLDCVD